MAIFRYRPRRGSSSTCRNCGSIRQSEARNLWCRARALRVLNRQCHWNQPAVICRARSVSRSRRWCGANRSVMRATRKIYRGTVLDRSRLSMSVRTWRDHVVGDDRVPFRGSGGSRRCRVPHRPAARCRRADDPSRWVLAARKALVRRAEQPPLVGIDQRPAPAYGFQSSAPGVLRGTCMLMPSTERALGSRAQMPRLVNSGMMVGHQREAGAGAGRRLAGQLAFAWCRRCIRAARGKSRRKSGGLLQALPC